MNTLDGNDYENAAPSTAFEQDGSAAIEAVAAESSAATGETSREELLSVVRDVVDKGAKSSESDSPSDGVGDVNEQASEKTPLDNDNYTDVPFHKHPRFRQVLGEAKANKQAAVEYQQVQDFLSQQGVSPQEAADALTIAGLLKSNPVEACRRLKPVMQQLLQLSGELIPPGLAQRVQTGELSPEAALEISRAQAQTYSLSARQDFERKLREQDMEKRSEAERMHYVGQWEHDRRNRDPNYASKEPLLLDALAGLQRREGVPKAPGQVKDQLDRAYELVNRRFAPAQPRPPIRPVRSEAPAGGSRAAPTGTLDIIDGVLGRG